MLSAMAVHPTRPLFATAAEDATMAVWQMPDDDQEVCWLLSSSLVAAFVSSQQQATYFQLRMLLPCDAQAAGVQGSESGLCFTGRL